MSKAICRASTQAVVHALQRCSFLINHLKSKLIPENIFQWLGVQWNTTRAIISHPVEKIDIPSRNRSSHSKYVREGHGRTPVCIHSGPNRVSHSGIYKLILHPKSQKRQEVCFFRIHCLSTRLSRDGHLQVPWHITFTSALQ